MCGRFAQTDPIDVLAGEYRIDEVITDLPPSYNIAPGDRIISIIKLEQKRQLVDFTWGLVPSWQKDSSKSRPLINARSETVDQKPSFKKAFERRRCLIPASGYFEWLKEGKVKLPVYINLSERGSFCMAGLYEHAAFRDGSELVTCTILTTGANESLKPVHDRMPVILPQENEDLWLDTTAPAAEIKALFKSYDYSLVNWHRVSPIVNSPRNNSPECIIPV